MSDQKVIWEELGHPPERKNLKGYAAPPGTGPKGETCKTCDYKVKKPGVSGHYLKCWLIYRHWTGGQGTDIKAGSPACREWIPIEEIKNEIR